jgi:hypothetical protein
VGPRTPLAREPFRIRGTRSSHKSDAISYLDDDEGRARHHLTGAEGANSIIFWSDLGAECAIPALGRIIPRWRRCEDESMLGLRS